MLLKEIKRTMGMRKATRSRKTMDKPSTRVSSESGKPTQDVRKI
jgi:hypothetical protein